MTVLLLLLAALVVVATVWIVRERPEKGPSPLRNTGALYRRQYSRRNFLKLGGAVGGVALLAYSGLDETVDTWHREHVKSGATDALSHVLHLFGERFWFGYWAIFAFLDGWAGSVPLTRWGRRIFEAMVVGLPALWGLQFGLGASRPSDNTYGPRFHPFADQNSASGHTFLAAIPCLVAARMLTRIPAKATAYALSPIVGWSRINDRKHYLSQVLLGFGIAWTSVETVMEASPPAPDSRTSGMEPDAASV